MPSATGMSDESKKETAHVPQHILRGGWVDLTLAKRAYVNTEHRQVPNADLQIEAAQSTV